MYYDSNSRRTRIYRPDRWDNPPEAISSTPGVWGHLLTFSGGVRACIGYRLSLIECVLFFLLALLGSRDLQGLTRRHAHRLKALIFTLIRAFEFELAVPPEDVQAVGVFIQRVGVRGNGNGGRGLPFLVRPVRRM